MRSGFWVSAFTLRTPVPAGLPSLLPEELHQFTVGFRVSQNECRAPVLEGRFHWV